MAGLLPLLAWLLLLSLLMLLQVTNVGPCRHALAVSVCYGRLGRGCERMCVGGTDEPPVRMADGSR